MTKSQRDNSVGPRIRELREGAGLSQAKLAELTGVSRNAVSQWEAGTTQPSTKRLVLLARALKVPIDQMVMPSARLRDTIVEAAGRMIDKDGVDAVTIDAVCLQVDCDRSALESFFPTRQDLLFAVISASNERSLEQFRRVPPRYGSLAARIKSLLRLHAVHDLTHLKLTASLHSQSWIWDETRERDHNRRMFEHYDAIIALFDEAAAKGQIEHRNFRAATQLVMAAYLATLRKAIHSGFDADRLISSLEPQLAILLEGVGFRDIPGFSENEPGD